MLNQADKWFVCNSRHLCHKQLSSAAIQFAAETAQITLSQLALKRASGLPADL